MRNTGKRRSKKCRAQNEDSAGSRSIASFNKDLRDQKKSKMAVWGGLTNSCDKKRREKQRSKGKI